MIVRNSSACLNDCLASIRPWVDEMIVVDTGSTDSTIEIAETYGAKVFEFPWCDDFSAARNVSLSHASNPWVFWMDSDDTIPEACGRSLKQLGESTDPADVDGFVMQVHCPAYEANSARDVTVVDHVKMFRNDRSIRFEGRIHEQILPAIRQSGDRIVWTDIYVVHSGSDQSIEGRFRKYERDLRLLSLDLAERPDHPFVLFNIGMTYVDMDDYKSARQPLERCLEVADLCESHVRKAYSLLIGTYQQLGLSEEASKLCEEATQVFPDDPELCFRKAGVLHAAGRLSESVSAYIELSNLDRSGRFFSSVDAGICGYKAQHNLAIVYTELKRFEDAEAVWKEVIESNPTFIEAWDCLIECLLSQRKFDEADTLISDFPQYESSTALVAQWRLKRLKAIGNVSAVRSEVERLLSSPARPQWAVDVAARFYFEQGSWKEAVEVVSELCCRDHAGGAAFQNLGALYIQKKMWPAAAMALRRSLDIRPNALETRNLLHDVEFHCRSADQ